MGRLYDETWGRGFTALYDRMTKATEEAGLREMRREALAGARGRTVDVGAGTGANLDLYPEGVEQLLLAEPDPHMLKKLRPKAAASGRDVEVLAAPGRAAAVGGLERRHGRLHARPLHGARPGGGAD